MDPCPPRTSGLDATRQQMSQWFHHSSIVQKPLAWDVTVPDTYAEAHVANSSRQAGAAANLAANNKVTKYNQLTRTHVFYPVAIETACTWHHQAIELVKEIGNTPPASLAIQRIRRYLFQQLSMALRRGNAVSFQSTFTASESVAIRYLLFYLMSVCFAWLFAR